ncbi:MAG: hypothetical protein LBH59_10670, partial [Planctomycetaceae bacterium]|nr:hypothetical protein [Planctomycetaceae bacterium]
MMYFFILFVLLLSGFLGCGFGGEDVVSKKPDDLSTIIVTNNSDQNSDLGKGKGVDVKGARGSVSRSNPFF